jgi:ribose 5-phosphate isomerase A
MPDRASENVAGKLQAANAAAAMVAPGMAVGLGSGSTAALVVKALGERVAGEGLRIVGVPTSVATAELARSLGIPLRDLDDVDALDLNLDGADEVDPAFAMIKGRGGALLREKVVASAARLRVTVITPEKRVARLGQHAPVPVEVSPVGTRHIERHLREIAAETALRLRPDGSPYLTDGGNKIIDCRFLAIDDPAGLDHRLNGTIGVFESGLFVGLCDVLLVGHGDHVERVENPLRPAGITGGSSASPPGQ